MDPSPHVNTEATAIMTQDDNCLSPFQKFAYALNAKETKRQYPQRLLIFLDYLQIPGKTVAENLFFSINR
jgi:hypothetical protein